MTKYSTIFQKFLNLTQAVDNLAEFSELTADERHLIKCLNSFWVNKENITVVNAMNLENNMSTSTTFRILKKLRQKGFIKLTIDKADSRIKYVNPTDKIQSLFHQYGKILMKVANDEI